MTEEEITTLKRTVGLKTKEEKETTDKAELIMKSQDELSRYKTLLKLAEQNSSMIESKDESSYDKIKEILIKSQKKSVLKSIKNEKKKKEKEVENDFLFDEPKLVLDHPQNSNEIFEIPISTFTDTKPNAEINKILSKSFAFTE